MQDVLLRLEFCLQAHCFQDIYAKVIQVEEGPSGPSISSELPLWPRTTGNFWTNGVVARITKAKRPDPRSNRRKKGDPRPPPASSDPGLY